MLRGVCGGGQEFGETADHADIVAMIRAAEPGATELSLPAFLRVVQGGAAGGGGDSSARGVKVAQQAATPGSLHSVASPMSTTS